MGLTEPIAFDGTHSDDDVNLFGSFRWLYPIRIDGQTFWVPEDNTVLRSLQYLAVKANAVRLPWHTYCWNNRDGCCHFRFRAAPDGVVREARACVTPARPGMEIVQLPEGGALCPSTF